MSATNEIDLRRVILQSLESWSAGGITHLSAKPLPLQPLSDPQPVAGSPEAVNHADESTAVEPPVSEIVPPAVSHETESYEPPPALKDPEPPMAKKSATAKPKQWFDVNETESTAAPKGPPVVKDLPREGRIAELKILSETVAKCTRCEELASTRTQTVFGVGNPEARVVFVGEAPGADEDAQGEPFVGRAGQLLNKIIEAMKLKREEIYICNVLRCRPPGNRLPAPQEACNCREFLDGQLGIINPEYIVCWGSCAAQNLLGVTESIGKMRGRFFQYGTAQVLCTYHPSYLLRNPAAKKDVWEDMKILMKELGIAVE